MESRAGSVPTTGFAHTRSSCSLKASTAASSRRSERLPTKSVR